MSVSPARDERQSPAETIGGFLATASIFLSVAALAYRPVRLLPAAILFALIAAGIGGRYSRLAAIALGVAAVCFFAGLSVAVLVGHPLY